LVYLSRSERRFLDLTPDVTDTSSVGFEVQRRWKAAVRDQRACPRKDSGMDIEYMGQHYPQKEHGKKE
jgi:hypothetical protein